MNSTPRKVLVVVGVYNGIWVAGRGTFIDDVLSRLGLENAARTYSWSAVSIEKILEWSPDIVLVTPMGIDERVLKESGLNMLEGRIHLLNETEADIMLRPGPLIAQAPSVIIKYIELSQAKAPVPTASATTATSTAGPTGSNSSIPTILTVALIFLVLGALIGRYAWRIK
jgi:iron complex transport system substrate-binding protein